MASHGTLRMHHNEHAVTFQADGRATMHHGFALRRAAESALTAGAPEVRVDLRRCTYMDSTFMGTLLVLLRAVKRRGWGRFALVAPSSECIQLIDQMGLTEIYPVVDVDEATDWADIPTLHDDQPGVCRTVVQAHKELATLPGKTGETFQRVAQCLEREAGTSANDDTLS